MKLKLNNLPQLQTALVLQNLNLKQRAHLTLRIGLLQVILQTLPLLMRSTPTTGTFTRACGGVLIRLWYLTTER